MDSMQDALRRIAAIAPGSLSMGPGLRRGDGT